MLLVERRQFLDLHLQEKLFNHGWLGACTQDPNYFPYRIAENGTAKIVDEYVFPADQTGVIGQFIDFKNKPLYIINIPLRCPKDDGTAHTRLLELFKCEAFGNIVQESRAEVSQRVFMVIGVNQMDSLDQSVNIQFEEHVRNLKTQIDIPHFTYGFRWAPEWRLRPEDRVRGILAQVPDQRLYDPKRAFCILKLHNRMAAQHLRAMTEEDEKNGLNQHARDQIPYQRIRQNMKLMSQPIADFYTKKSQEGHIYYGVMDADCIHLRNREGNGLLSRLDAQISVRGTPSVISLGYSVDAPPAIAIGVKLDMKVRQAVSTVFPYGVYYPEPGLFVCIRRPGQPHILAQLSFLGMDKGEKLESRWLIRNGRKSGVLHENAVFFADDGVLTTAPARMYTNSNAAFTINQIKQKCFLKALRGISQSHLDPNERAGNLYFGLGITANFYAIKGPLSNIFNVFDPISRMLGCTGKYSKVVFDQVMSQYHEPLSDGLTNLLHTGRGQLMQRFKLEKELIDRIEEAARRAGLAIFEVLSSYT